MIGVSSFYRELAQKETNFDKLHDYWCWLHKLEDKYRIFIQFNYKLGQRNKSDGTCIQQRNYIFAYHVPDSFAMLI